MRHLQLLALGTLLAPIGMTVAEEPVYEVQWNEVQGEGFVPYSGTPDHPTIPNLYADDFTIEQTTEVDRIGWFGYSDFWDNPDLTNFTKWEVRIYEGQGQGVEPGAMIYQEVFQEAATNPQPLGPHGLYGATMYRHEVELARTVQLDGGSQYWIGIGADAISGASDWWIWAQAPPGDETIARWHWDDEEWTVQFPDFDPDWPTYNTAFQIFGSVLVDCVGDLNSDGEVNVLDLLTLLEEWGECDDPDDCPADLNGDGFVNVLDLLIVLENWGPC